VPNDIVKLTSSGFTVYVQASPNRVYSDNEYENAGALITTDEWFNFKDSLLVGLKELNRLDKLDNHIHIYFSHSFKGQNGAAQILDSFKNSKSTLYDHEFFVDGRNQRLTAFGHHAGITGAAVGLLYHNYAKTDLTPWTTIESLYLDLKHVTMVSLSLSIAIIGDGRCAQGVKSVLDKLEIPYAQFNKGSNMKTLLSYDIIYNCILLDPQYNETWFDESTQFTKKLTIVDISCDYSKSNNPIKLYNKATTWSTPAIRYNEYVSIIAIENLPSLLPKECSDCFSSKFTDLLLDYKDDSKGVWQRAYNHFSNQLHFAP